MISLIRASLTILVMTFFFSHVASAQTAYGGRVCGSGTSPGGTVIWDYNDIFDLDMQFCDGSTWFSMATLTGAACTAPDAGKMQWNVAGYFEYCNGTNWIDTKGKLFATCTNGDNKKMRWNSGATALQSCDGNNWYNIGPTTVQFTTSGTWVVPTYATTIRITVWGGGGGGGQAQTGGSAPQQGANGTSGTLSSAAIPAPINLTITANPGLFGSGANNTGPGAGGAGGTGVSGDTTVTGGNGEIGDVAGSGNVGGDGGAAYRGGKAGTPTGPKGKDGLAPGGGGAGDTGTSTKNNGGGGGAGGYAQKIYNDTSLIGLTLTMTIGTGGTKANSGSGNGGAGKVIITYW